MDRPHPYRRPITSADRRQRLNHPAYLCEWSAVVGDRIRRLRRDRGMRLVDLARAVPKPEGGHFSPGYISRIERGWATATLYAYLAIAAALDVDPGRLLGPDAAATDIGEDEAILLRCVSELGIEPHQAVLRLARG